MQPWELGMRAVWLWRRHPHKAGLCRSWLKLSLLVSLYHSMSVSVQEGSRREEGTLLPPAPGHILRKRTSNQWPYHRRDGKGDGQATCHRWPDLRPRGQRNDDEASREDAGAACARDSTPSNEGVGIWGESCVIQPLALLNAMEALVQGDAAYRKSSCRPQRSGCQAGIQA